MRVAVYPDGEYEALDNYNLPPAEAAQRWAEENGDTDDEIDLIVTPIDDEARALSGWLAAEADDEEGPFMLFRCKPTTTWSATRVATFNHSAPKVP